MIDLGIGIFLLIIILELILKVKIYSPSFLFVVSFLILFILEKLQLYGLFTAKNDSYTVVIIGVLSFCVGCMVVLPFWGQNNLNLDQKMIVKDYTVQVNAIRKKLLFSIIFALVIEFLYAIPSILYLRSGGSLYDMRYIQQNIIQRSGLISFLHVYVSLPILYISLPISAFDFFINGQKKIFVLTLVTTLFYFIGNGARMPLIYLILSYITIFLMFFDLLKENKKLKKILLSTIIIIIVINLLTIIRKSGQEVSTSDQTFLQGIYYYITCSMINLGDKLSYVSAKPNLLGTATFYGFFLPLTNVINIPVATNAKDFFDLIQNSVINISNIDNSPYNFCVTGFLPSYADGKIWGVIVFSFLIGILMQFVFKKLERSDSLKWLVLYSLMMEAIMMYVITNMFSSISFCMAILFSLFFLNIKVVKGEQF
ncbi:oligosaccharide repeat unit polymerase [Limosilactobacillus agrestis]|uniref:O-antigen polymerase n=1 Tax=Limosilactobacillus agrestis TaxID=2759748 RepID=UPI001E42C706|nr:O-antigen polymerase [Limosilactobacillus agrestis]MCD7120630.1 oligosaccharide repeat unit polymerase [Limosilactobacillus agrestis]